MSNLTVGLAVIGGLVLAGVVAHGAWTSRRNAPRQAEDSDTMPPGGYDEVFTGAERNEPTLDGPLVASADGVDRELHPLGPLPTPEKKPRLDALIDVIAPIALDGPVSGEAALAALPPTRRAGSKPFGVEGLNTASQEWEWPQAGQWYVQFQAGVQLANRTGALNEIEFSEFVVKAQAFADAIGGTADFPEMLHERRATELHAARRQQRLEPRLRAAECRAPGLRGRCDSGPHGAAGGRSRAAALAGPGV
jgi:hypothetical protein